MPLCGHAYLHVCIYVCMYVRTCVRMYVCMHACTACMSCMSCHVMSCHVMSCHVMSCHVMSCHVTYVRIYICTHMCSNVCSVCVVFTVYRVLLLLYIVPLILLPYIVPCFDGHVNSLARPGVTCAWYCIIFFGIIRCAPWLSGSRQGLLWQSLPRKKHRGHVRVWDFKVPCFRGIGLVVEV